jgi:hypothetical protein
VVILRLISGVSPERETFLHDIWGKVLWFVVSTMLRAYLSLRIGVPRNVIVVVP